MSTPGSSPAVVGRIEAALAGGGLQPTRRMIGGGEVIIGSTSVFKWRWMATRLNIFVYSCAFQPGSATSGLLDQWMAAACQDAINRKGALRALQQGVAAVTVAVIDNATNDDQAWAAKPHGRRFAAVTFPVLADPSAKRVIRPERMVLGGIYTGYLQELVRTYVETAVA